MAEIIGRVEPYRWCGQELPDLTDEQLASALSRTRNLGIREAYYHLDAERERRERQTATRQAAERIVGAFSGMGISAQAYGEALTDAGYLIRQRFANQPNVTGTPEMPAVTTHKPMTVPPLVPLRPVSEGTHPAFTAKPVKRKIDLD